MSFFFQAEDGIRDYKVTGVQTCALPIYHWVKACRRDGPSTIRRRERTRVGDQQLIATSSGSASRRDRKSVVEGKSVGHGDGDGPPHRTDAARRPRPTRTHPRAAGSPPTR